MPFGICGGNSSVINVHKNLVKAVTTSYIKPVQYKNSTNNLNSILFGKKSNAFCHTTSASASHTQSQNTYKWKRMTEFTESLELDGNRKTAKFNQTYAHACNWTKIVLVLMLYSQNNYCIRLQAHKCTRNVLCFMFTGHAPHAHQFARLPTINNLFNF